MHHLQEVDMTGVVGHESSNRDVQVIIGVDTHQDQHVAVAIDQRGVRLDEKQPLGLALRADATCN